MTEDWRTCVEQERYYSLGWRWRIAGDPMSETWMEHAIIGWHDADRRLTCPAMYAGYYQKRESP